MSTKDAVRRAIELGADVKYKGGEVVLSWPGLRPVATQHWTRRKDASRELMRFVRDLEHEAAGTFHTFVLCEAEPDSDPALPLSAGRLASLQGGDPCCGTSCRVPAATSR